MIDRRMLLAGGVACLSAIPAFGRTTVRRHRRPGAHIPWRTYPAEDMQTNGAVMGPKYGPYLVEMESSRQKCVKLEKGGFVEFKVRAPANAMVIRYSLPDSLDGNGLDATLLLNRNGKPVRQIPITSRFTWRYGDYPFTSDPADGKARNFYDDARVKGVKLTKGDVVRLVFEGDAPYCIIDIIDLEDVAPPLRQPANSLSVVAFGADRTGQADSTKAVRACLAEAAAQSRIAWAPPGDYKLTGDIVMPPDVTLQGAGMWHTTFVGDEDVYGHADRRLRFRLTGLGSQLADFALVGKLKYRNDSEQNDGVFGAHAENCTVSRLWIEHTKVGMWFYVCRGITIEGCRMRNTLADGINLCVDTRDCVIEECTARNTGDDCFAIWPSPADQGFTQEGPVPGNNVIRRCTGQLPFLAHGGSIYGGAGNRIEDCVFTDIASGCGILISTTFETSNDKIDNNFTGETAVKNCEIVRCGGYDHGWTWRAALQICLHRRPISGLRISDVVIRDSISDAIAVITGGDAAEAHVLSDARLERVTVTNYGIGAPGRHGLWIEGNASGSLTIVNSSIPAIRNNSTSFSILNT